MATRKVQHTETNTGTAHMEATAARLQGIKDELDEAAAYFERLGMSAQVDALDEAQTKVEDVWELLECLLGRVGLDLGLAEVAPPPSLMKGKAKRSKVAA